MTYLSRHDQYLLREERREEAEAQKEVLGRRYAAALITGPVVGAALGFFYGFCQQSTGIAYHDIAIGSAYTDIKQTAITGATASLGSTATAMVTVGMDMERTLDCLATGLTCSSATFLFGNLLGRVTAQFASDISQIVGIASQ